MNIKYKNIIDDYKNTKRSGEVELVLREFRTNPPEIDQKLFTFLNQIIVVAESNNHQRIVALTRDVSNKLKYMGDGQGQSFADIIGQSLTSIGECIDHFNHSMNNDQAYASVIEIVEFIRRSKDFNNAYKMLEVVVESKYSNNLSERNQIINYYISQIDEIINNEIKPERKGLFRVYKSETWRKINDPYEYYLNYKRTGKLR